MGTLLEWPHSGTHRATGLLSEQDLDAAQLRRVLNTAHEPDALNDMQRHAADEQAASRRWHQQNRWQPGCTGNCSAGRPCDCVADCDAQQDPPRQPLTRRERVLLVAIYVCSAGAVSTVLWLIFGRG
jgi:hypothetical protein